MKKRLAVVCLLAVVILSIFGLQSRVINTVPLNVAKLEPGDILFVDLYEGWDQAGFWDHMGIYIGEVDYAGELNGVVESTFDSGVIIISLDSFIERDRLSRFSVRRLENMPGREEVIERMIEYALNSVGKPFDVTATATIPLKVNDRNLHCVEVVWQAYKVAGINLDSNGGLILYPDDIYFSSRLVPVK